jgi:O-antigen/teichoic acid export membrane protein
LTDAERGALLTIATVPALALQGGLTGAVTGLVAVEAAKGLLLLTLYRRMIRAEGVAMLTPVRRGDAPLLWRFGLPMFLSSALWAPTLWLAQIIVKTQAPDGLVAVGVFGFANNILGAVILLSGLTNRALMPILSSLHARGAFDELRRTSWLLAVSQTAAAAIIGFPMAVAAPFIMNMAGPEFARQWPVLITMIVTGVIIAGQTTLVNSLLVLDRPYLVLATMFLWSLTIISAVSICAANGAYALAGGLLIASGLRTACLALAWKRVLN